MNSKILQLYLRFWAKKYLDRTRPKIIAITGSVGKTSTKEAVFAVLKQKYNNEVAKSTGNLNTETGVPLAILGFEKSPTKFYEWLPILLTAPFLSQTRKSYKIMVLEMAADKPGDIKYLTSIAKPDIAIITAIGPSHLAAFGQISRIVEEKISLLWALPSDGVAILNLDDDNVRKASYGGRWAKLTYGIDQEADFIANGISTTFKKGLPETKFKVKGKINLSITTQMLGGRAQVYAALAAVAVGENLGLSVEEVETGLARLLPEKHRMEIFAGKNDTTIIDDSYNASPLSIRNSLAVLKCLNSKGRKIAVLGDMRELGPITDEAHQSIGREAAQIADQVVAVGDLARKYNGQKYFKNKDKAIVFLLKEARPGDIILIKASRAISLDKIADALRETN